MNPPKQKRNSLYFKCNDYLSKKCLWVYNVFMQIETFLIENPWVLLLIILWVLPWKGYALWRASKNNHKKWFVVLFLINTLAILDIIYIFAIDRRQEGRIIK